MTANVDFSLTPVDNARLANLCGSMDENIAHISRALAVNIKRRGECFRLSGESAAEAAEALRALYQRADKTIAGNDVRLQLAHVFSDAPREAAAAIAPRPVAPGGARFRARTAAQQAYWDKIISHSVTLCAGPAGTGKTHTAVAAALSLLRAAGGRLRRLVLSRPVLEAGGERLGFLPGDMEQKITPYLRPLYDILHQLQGRQETERSLATGEIEIIPLAFMRGITLNDTALILDEAQNTTPLQMKMLLTRLGGGSKIIINGDTLQSDLPAGATSGLSDAMARLTRINDIIIHRFSDNDIVRHPLARDILKAYENN